MSVSLRSLAASCLDVTGDFSVRAGIYGYPHGAINRELRLLSHISNIRGQAINLSVILVAHEPGYGGQFTQANCQRIQAGIDRMREIYAQVGLGVRRIYWSYIPVAQAGGYSTVDGSEATDLTNDWSGDNDGIDVFWVSNVTDAGGWSNSDGPCNKDQDKVRTGAVLEISNSDDFTGILLAHEVGHYLRLRHFTTITNLMGVDSNNDGIGELNSTSTDLTSDQGDRMKDSCFVRNPC
ncbi:hypothetical protein [Meridianimarinicoccus aquatilis]|uniref:Uncharacterized protein n=1 Tax=Meridianimarinicoccus aquatilis TaxID=2552766 RepID=A0A4R6B5H4_9RHOB|nr:hypothetical protein [Fluviibacterium aquatile]QIE43443.1 hypothetical protein G5B39_15560 [Rhodobacteraceae bacterium SC52]TDL90783.1 hypothetical protein E2L05_03195 [Fluviibacterium aquatile]